MGLKMIHILFDSKRSVKNIIFKGDVSIVAFSVNFIPADSWDDSLIQSTEVNW